MSALYANQDTLIRVTPPGCTNALASPPDAHPHLLPESRAYRIQRWIHDAPSPTRTPASTLPPTPALTASTLPPDDDPQARQAQAQDWELEEFEREMALRFVIGRDLHLGFGLEDVEDRRAGSLKPAARTTPAKRPTTAPAPDTHTPTHRRPSFTPWLRTHSSTSTATLPAPETPTRRRPAFTPWIRMQSSASTLMPTAARPDHPTTPRAASPPPRTSLLGLLRPPPVSPPAHPHPHTHKASPSVLSLASHFSSCTSSASASYSDAGADPERDSFKVAAEPSAHPAFIVADPARTFKGGDPAHIEAHTDPKDEPARSFASSVGRKIRHGYRHGFRASPAASPAPAPAPAPAHLSSPSFHAAHAFAGTHSSLRAQSLGSSAPAPAPPHRVFAASPSHRVFAASPSHRVFAPAPSHRVFAPSPSHRVFAPSPSHSVLSAPPSPAIPPSPASTCPRSPNSIANARPPSAKGVQDLTAGAGARRKRRVSVPGAKKRRMVIRGVAEDDEWAVEGVRRWAGSFGEVSRMCRAQDGAIWVEYRDRKVAESVCCLQAQVQIPHVGRVVLDWAEGRHPG